MSFADYLDAACTILEVVGIYLVLFVLSIISEMDDPEDPWEDEE